MHNDHSTGGTSWLRSWTALACLALLGLAGYFLLTEYGERILGSLPFLLILLCPLMHFFMMRGHGGHGADGGRGERGAPGGDRGEPR